MAISVTDIPEREIDISAMRSSGPGGQNVNKVSTAIHLRFDIDASSLPDELKSRLKRLRDSRLTGEGVIVIKAQQFRSQEKNREDALARLDELLQRAQVVRKVRRQTKPSKSAVARRLDEKKLRGKAKALRRDPDL
ncbi:MAG: alternative ribosome rescue aminoacyl-tRNA hydrolase ArfB [Pseudomonadota bacterium]